MRFGILSRAKALLTGWTARWGGERVGGEPEKGDPVGVSEGSFGWFGWISTLIPMGIGGLLSIVAIGVIFSPLVLGGSWVTAFLWGSSVMGLAWLWSLGVPKVMENNAVLWAIVRSRMQGKTLNQYAAA